MTKQRGQRLFKLWALVACLWAGALCSHTPLHAAADTTTPVDIKPGDVVFQTDFEGATALQSWGEHDAKKIRLMAGRNGSQSLTTEAPAAEGASSVMIRVPLPVEKLRGARLKLEAMVKSENVVKPPQAWNGVKFMLHTVAPDVPRWEQQNNVFGTFDWKPVSFTTRVPKDATEAWLMLGVEATTGQAWFDDIKITVVSLPRSRPTQPAARRSDSGPRLRGAMISPRVTADDLRVLAEKWGANHVRWQLMWNGFPQSPADSADEAAYDVWLEGALKHLDDLLPVCKELGIAVLIDLHTPPGGRNAANECRIFHEKKWQDKFLQVWDKIAQRYKGNTTVWGYDLVNEPVEGIVPDDLMIGALWPKSPLNACAPLTYSTLSLWSPRRGALPLRWKSSSRSICPTSFTAYICMSPSITHQGVFDNPMGFTYPGEISGKKWDKEQLRRSCSL
jgi:hypothetical protein